MLWPQAPSLIDRASPHFSGIKRWGVPKLSAFMADPFHTLLNLTWPRFIFVFFMTYMMEYLVFAFVFYAQVRARVCRGGGCHIGGPGRAGATPLVLARARPRPGRPAAVATAVHDPGPPWELCNLAVRMSKSPQTFSRGRSTCQACPSC